MGTIRSVYAGRKSIPPEIAMEFAEHHAHDALTEREIDVLHYVASGKSNEVIADKLDLF
ncbi:MAG: LuxR C-terminal-related transcriptional regulator [Candidatus Sulfotelmatobacter sp.]